MTNNPRTPSAPQAAKPEKCPTCKACGQDRWHACRDPWHVYCPIEAKPCPSCIAGATDHQKCYPVPAKRDELVEAAREALSELIEIADYGRVERKFAIIGEAEIKSINAVVSRLRRALAAQGGK
jgi:hypothetical protein